MSHNVEHFTYTQNVDKKRVQAELDGYVMHADYYEGCRGLYNDIRWLDKKIYANSSEAYAAIEALDRGSYDCLAVQFYAAKPFTDAKRQQLEAKEKEAAKELLKREQTLYPKTLTSALLGCKSCGSRLSVKHLKSNRCPVCDNDLRPDYILKSIEAAKNKAIAATQNLTEYIEKKSKKDVYWLVKIEYHT